MIDAVGGNDFVTGLGDDDTILGGIGNDFIFGDVDFLAQSSPSTFSNSGDDVIDAGDGNNAVIGNGGSDLILGGSDNDALGAVFASTDGLSDDTDTILARGGNDFVAGAMGMDLLFGEEGNDVMVGFSNSDSEVRSKP